MEVRQALIRHAHRRIPKGHLRRDGAPQLATLEPPRVEKIAKLTGGPLWPGFSFRVPRNSCLAASNPPLAYTRAALSVCLCL